jgi:hypothetical protein
VKRNEAFTEGEPVTRVVVYLTQPLEDVSSMDIQTTLHKAGYGVHSVHARRNTDFASA